MLTDSQDTCNSILTHAKAEFLALGFERASLRTIATKAGVTTGAVYRHFNNKQDLFDALVAPIRNDVLLRFQCETEAYINRLAEEGLAPMWNREESQWNMREFILYIYAHFDEFRLLFLASPPVAEDFFHALVSMEVDCSYRYFTAAKQQGYSCKVPDKKEIHLIANAQFSILVELVSHDIPKEDGLRYAATLERFFMAGWQAIILEV
ncbi:MAG: helix-turn-helix domain-containing protein [Sphaerochaeta sp.]|nr:helix-turn-helix domain-containing protein [Sphaerochaeta sp.]